MHKIELSIRCKQRSNLEFDLSLPLTGSYWEYWLHLMRPKVWASNLPLPECWFIMTWCCRGTCVTIICCPCCVVIIIFCGGVAEIETPQVSVRPSQLWMKGLKVPECVLTDVGVCCCNIMIVFVGAPPCCCDVCVNKIWLTGGGCCCATKYVWPCWFVASMYWVCG